MVLTVVRYGCKSWTIKKAEYQKLDAFELWYLKRLLRVLGLEGDLIRRSRQEEKHRTEDDMVRWHHQLNEY